MEVTTLLITLLWAVGIILFILGLIGVFTHLVGFGVGSIIIGAVLALVAHFAGGGPRRL